jgi:hypothetical protein
MILYQKQRLYGREYNWKLCSMSKDGLNVEELLQSIGSYKTLYSDPNTFQVFRYHICTLRDS